MSEFGKLWAAGTISSLGDGVSLVAGPLLAAALTRDPVQVAGLTVATRVPWVLLALPSGAVVDRFDRRALLAAASAARVVTLGVLGLAVALGQAGLPLLYAAFLLAGCAGVLFENASTTILSTVGGELGLDRANGRMLSTRTLGQTLLAPPLAGAVFAAANWAPFVLDAAAFVVVTALSLALATRTGPVPEVRASMPAAIAEGVRWLLRHRLLRTVAVTVALSNLALGATLSIMVLVAEQRFGLDPVGYGLLLTASAIGGVIGGLSAARIAAAVGTGTTLRIGLTVEAGAYLGLALTRDPVLAGLILLVLGLQLVVFSTIAVSLRQTLAPPGMLGRVHSTYRLLSSAGLALGAALGGLTAAGLGLTAPFWLGAVILVTAAGCTWRPLGASEVEPG